MNRRDAKTILIRMSLSDFVRRMIGAPLRPWHAKLIDVEAQRIARENRRADKSAKITTKIWQG
jgi:hypothetical protein